MTAPGLVALLAAAGITADTSPAGVAAVLASYDGPNHYQARAALPGGRIIYAGVHGTRRDWARADIAALFGTGPGHWTVTRIKPPALRTRSVRARLNGLRERLGSPLAPPGRNQP